MLDDQLKGRDPQRIRRMFAAVAPRYNLLNHLLSGCLDRNWRKVAVSMLQLSDQARVLDICAGTGHLARACLRRHPEISQMIVSDFVPEMLARCPQMLKNDPRVSFITADALHLPFPDASLDLAMNAFGLRNTVIPRAALAEMVRVVKPGGYVLLLEFFRPSPGWWRTPPGLWVRFAVPVMGKLISPHPEAYSYLPRSMNEFLSTGECVNILAQYGAGAARTQRLPAGVATVIIARRGG